MTEDKFDLLSGTLPRSTKRAWRELRDESSTVRRAKIICTLGPASSSEPTIRDLLLLGMDVARLNFSHGTYEEHARNIERLRRTSYQDRTGRWVFAFRDPANRRFHVRVPPQQPDDGDVTVEVYLPSR